MDNSNNNLPASVQAMLDAFMKTLDQKLPERLGGLYLYGSTAKGGYNNHYSDLDLLAVLNGVLSEPELDQLEALHGEFITRYPESRLEVHYFQWVDLGQEIHSIPAHPYFSDSILKRAETHHLNPITWYELKRHSLTLRGPQPGDLPYEIGWPAVREWNKRGLKYYWGNWTRKPRNLISLLQDEVSYWSVLGICRLYYNLDKCDVTTKEYAGEYVLDIAPPKYERVLREALRIRSGQGRSYYRSRIFRAVDIVRFMNYMAEQCERVVAD